MNKHEGPKKPKLKPWSSAPDSNRPLMSEPAVWEVEGHRRLVKLVEKHLRQQAASDFDHAPELHCPAVPTRWAEMRRWLLYLGSAVLILFGLLLTAKYFPWLARAIVLIYKGITGESDA
jgi:hypothetical protein